MTVNYFDIGIIVFMAVFAISGYFRGLVINLVNFIRLSLGAFLCFYISSNAAMPVYNLFIKHRALDTINKQITTSKNIDTVIENLNDFVSNLPPFIAKGIDVKTIDVTSAELSKNILENVFEPVLITAVKVVIFIAVLLIFFGITGLMVHAAVKRSKRREEERGRKSTAKKIDRFFGLLLGILKGAIIVFAVVAVIMFITPQLENISGSKDVISQIDKSVCLKFIDEINPFNAITEGII